MLSSSPVIRRRNIIVDTFTNTLKTNPPPKFNLCHSKMIKTERRSSCHLVQVSSVLTHFPTGLFLICYRRHLIYVHNFRFWFTGSREEASIHGVAQTNNLFDNNNYGQTEPSSTKRHGENSGHRITNDGVHIFSGHSSGAVECSSNKAKTLLNRTRTNFVFNHTICESSIR